MRKLLAFVIATMALAAAILLIGDEFDLRQRGRNLWEVTAEPIADQIWRKAPRRAVVDEAAVREIARAAAEDALAAEQDRRRSEVKRAPAPVAAVIPKPTAPADTDLKKRAGALPRPGDRKMVLGLIASGKLAAADSALVALASSATRP